MAMPLDYRPILIAVAVLIPLPLVAQWTGRSASRQVESRSSDEWRESNQLDLSEPSSESTDRTARSKASAVGRTAAAGFNEFEGDPGRFSAPAYANAGQVWREYNLAAYTNRLANVAHPEAAVVEWIVRQTGPETWHGEEVAVLSATRGRLRVFHRDEIQEQVAEIVERFTRSVQSQITIRVQVATTTDLNWRSGLVHLLKPVAYGSEGQQAWLLAPEDAALLRHRLPSDRFSASLSQQVVATNGQEACVESGHSVSYISGLELAGGSYAAYQPVIGRVQDGVRVSFTPLWTRDGAALDVTLRLTTRAVQKLHSAQGATPLSTGNQGTVLQVPETVASNFEQTLRWPTSQVLLISAGVQPPRSRRTAFGFAAAATELLVLAEVIPTYARPATQRDAPAYQ
jgi:hypothetical protein